MGIKRAFRKIWSFQERNLKDGIAKGEKMAYYSSHNQILYILNWQ